MPELIRSDLSIKDVKWRRTKFKRLRIGQIFYSRGRWYSKRTFRTAAPADSSDNKASYFRGDLWVRVFNLSEQTLRPARFPEPFEEFLARAAGM